MLVAAVSLGALAVAPAIAQTTQPAPTTPPPAAAPAPTPTPAPTVRRESNPAITTSGMLASKIIGTKVKNNAGENVGTIDDLVIRPNDQVVMAVVSVGGFLGIGDRKVAVPWSDLSVSTTDRSIVYDVTKQQLEQKPEFKADRQG